METVEVVVAIVGRAHGVRGEVFLTVRTDEPDRRFRRGVQLRVENTSRMLALRAVTWASGKLRVGFEGVNDRNAAEALRGTVLVADVPADELPSDDDEYYDRQLIGLKAVLVDGSQVGDIADVLHLPAQDVLAVKTGDGEKLVPFVQALVPRIDLEKGLVELSELPGLLDDQAIDDGSNSGNKEPEGENI